MAEVARRTGLAYNTVSYHRDRIRLDDGDVATTSSEPLPLESFLVPITTRQEVHQLLQVGCSRAEVARRLGISKSTVTYHARRFGMAIDPGPARRYDWRVIQRYYDAGHSVSECRTRFGFSNATWSSAVRRGDVFARPNAMPIDKLLAAPRGRGHLKRRLTKAGLLPTHCRVCGIENWQGNPLALELHHINGDGHDNRLENLALLCPNCHSQTDTWGGRSGKRGLALGPVVTGPAHSSAYATPAA